MTKLSIILAALTSFLGCVATEVPPAEATDESVQALGVEDGCPAAPGYCQGAPFSQLTGSGFSTWAASDCTGEYARGPLSQGLPCAQFHMPGDVRGDVYCADGSSPVPEIYFKDPNDNWTCKKWVLTSERWVIWRWCGVHPLQPLPQ